MTLDCDLFVDGHFEGIVESKGMITVGKNGNISGEISAKRLIVQGTVEGSIDVDTIEIKSTGNVSGIIISVELMIESKGVFKGESRIKSDSDELAETSLPLPKKELS
ncbi:MAG: polymer-forming cytoskeletal protein [Thiovulaceae bacterium]|nr:polymer-forming cytoskeletal protein [Sulfurimonadaceae bacterium]